MEAPRVGEAVGDDAVEHVVPAVLFYDRWCPAVRAGCRLVPVGSVGSPVVRHVADPFEEVVVPVHVAVDERDVAFVPEGGAAVFCPVNEVVGGAQVRAVVPAGRVHVELPAVRVLEKARVMAVPRGLRASRR